ncbi:hypothetical protein Patl1_02926 [Pistacia atlantica]|uniref:Uncharacterized protein n=1 Tax=Pistacia atlantica TaxID=434234 RepID=A0ACC1CCU5_9ROSI|nr:hypothetical protein Patl1_02926 [Pistacia atlantica]
MTLFLLFKTLVIQLYVLFSTGILKEPAAARTLKQVEEDVHEIHCSRERSRAAWKIIEEYLMPFVEKERYQISTRCRLHPDNDLFRDQEQHKFHVDINEWKCGFCKKRFYEEKYIDQHFDNRHYNLLNVVCSLRPKFPHVQGKTEVPVTYVHILLKIWSQGKCLADVCGALHCDLIMDSAPRKTKCNPAAASRNQHQCESLANSCFPVNEGPSASRLHEFFLRQFCDAHTCTGNRKPFSKGRRKQTSITYVTLSILALMVLPLFYIFVYLYQRGIRRGTQALKRISESKQKKKSF